MPAYMERICDHVSIIRQGEECHVQDDPYTWGATIIHLGPHKVEMAGVDRKVDSKVWQDVMDCLGKAGIEQIVCKRIKTIPVRSELR